VNRPSRFEERQQRRRSKKTNGGVGGQKDAGPKPLQGIEHFPNEVWGKEAVQTRTKIGPKKDGRRGACQCNGEGKSQGVEGGSDRNQEGARGEIGKRRKGAVKPDSNLARRWRALSREGEWFSGELRG